MDILFHGGTVITVNGQGEVIGDGAVCVRGNRIEAVGPSARLLEQYPDIPRREMRGKAILPGFINCHSHAHLTILKGLAEDVNTVVAVYGLMAAVGKLLSPKDIYNMTSGGMLEMIQSGTTTVVELQNGESAVEAIRDIGMRGVFSAGHLGDFDRDTVRYGVFQHDPALGETTMARALALVEKWHGAENGRIRCLLYPSATESNSLEYYRQVHAKAKELDLQIHTHMAQNRIDIERADDVYGMSPIQYYAKAGVLDERLMCGHCLYLGREDWELMARHGAHFVHCPGIINKRGETADTYGALQAGVNVCLGTDNMFEDMTASLRLAVTQARIRTGQPGAVTAADALRMATINGAKAIGMEQELGSLEAGKLADLIVMDLSAPHLLPVTAETAVDAIVYNAQGHDVELTMVDGAVIYEKGVGSVRDEQEVVSLSQKTAESIWVEFEKSLSAIYE